MDNGLLLVNFGALHQAGADIKKALNSLQSQLTQLEQDAAPLVETWSGEANEAYQVRQAKWRSASADLSAILRNIQLAVDDSAADYQVTEKRATNRFQ